MYIFLFILLFLLPVTVFPQAIPITIDGEFEDWEDASILFDNDDQNSTFDDLHIQRIRGANDDRFLFLRIELDREITLLDNNPLILLLDTDNDPSTGYSPDNFGAELRWLFGQRQGEFFTGATGHNIRFSNIRLRTAPTVTSSEFEIAIGRDSTPDGSTPLFQSDTVGVYISIDGDDAYAYGTYIFDPQPVAPPEPIPLERYDENDMRVLAFNAWDDKLFETQFTEQYQRILHTLEPDIIAFQEIWDHNAEETAQRVDELLPGGEEFQWHAVKKDRGNVTVSRFPIVDSWQILVWDGNEWSDAHRLTVSLIDTREEYGSKLLLVNVHLRCCAGGEANRWLEITALANFIDNAREPGGLIHIDEDTPIILAGDFNLVGSSGQLAAIENDIPDWDDSGLTRVRARQTEKRMHYTWRNDNSRFSPGKLDYIFYTGSVLSLQNHYTLQVEEMSPEQRNIYGLQYGDTQTASDHLPHVADFTFKAATGISEHTVPDGYFLGQNYPNPFNPVTSISFAVPETTALTITVYDMLGRKVQEVLDSTKTAGYYTVRMNGSALSTGVYYYTLHTGSFTQTRRMILIR